jgi:hypothetical protein
MGVYYTIYTVEGFGEASLPKFTSLPVVVNGFAAYNSREMVFLEGHRVPSGRGYLAPPTSLCKGDHVHRIKHASRANNYAARSASIRTCATSGRVNSGGGGVPARSSSRTRVPLSDNRCSASCGQVRGEAMLVQVLQ